MKKKLGRFQTLKNLVYEKTGDENSGVPPLFCWEVKITKIDTARVDMSKIKATVLYGLTPSK